jgi:nucleoside-diphosphate-sugar epimerase
MKTALVLGAGGFIGSWMVKRLKTEGYWVRGVDLKHPEFSKTEANEFLVYDLRDNRNVEAVMRLDYGTFKIPLDFSFYPKPFAQQMAFDEVYQFAADMGGAGYIFTGEHDADVMHNSASINLNVCEWAVKHKVGKVFYSSSACMYPQELQQTKLKLFTGEIDNNPDYGLLEDDAYPANPDSEYGWEKLFSERLYLAYARNYGLNVRIARFHNIFGPEGTWKGGKEKAPAALCRKVAESNGEVEIWGDGEQTRSFLYIDECIEGVMRLMESDFTGPVNIGSDEMISINDLALMVAAIAKKEITLKHIEGPQGVRGRNSDNTLIFEKLGWKPTQPLLAGINKTYKWIKSQVDAI